MITCPKCNSSSLFQAYHINPTKALVIIILTTIFAIILYHVEISVYEYPVDRLNPNIFNGKLIVKDNVFYKSPTTVYTTNLDSWLNNPIYNTTIISYERGIWTQHRWYTARLLTFWNWEFHQAFTKLETEP